MQIVRGIVAVVLATGALVGCSAADSGTDGKASRATVWLFANGDIELNGEPADLDAVEAAFRELADRGGVVLYGREVSEEERPHPNGIKITELVLKHRLPIRPSTKRDFSDVLGETAQP